MRDVPFPMIQLINQVRYTYPEMWARVKKKVYQNVEKFNDYRGIYVDFLMPAIGEFNRVTTSGIANGFIKSVLQGAHDIPIFFLSPELLAAARMSNINFTIDWENMSLPFPSFNIVLPKGGMFVKNEEVLFIDVTRIRKDEHQSLINQLPPLFKPQPKPPTAQFIINAATDQTSKYTRSLIDPYSPLTPSEELLIGSFELDATESEFAGLLPEMVFNILFAMAARPEYVETGNKVSVHKKSGMEIWSPNIIGRKYAVKRAAEAQGTHASPRMHWRRGHFRHQPFGKGLTETKVIWLEPTLIGVKEK